MYINTSFFTKYSIQGLFTLVTLNLCFTVKAQSPVYTTPYTISTIAGSALSGSGYYDASGSSAIFNQPYGIAVDSSGNLFVADSGNYVIRKITPAGLVTTIAGQAGNSSSTDGTGISATFGTIKGITIDSSGNLYVTDSSNNTVRKITVNTWNVTTLVASTSGLKSPTGITVDSSGNLYVSDSGNYVIRKISSSGSISTLAGTVGKSGISDGIATTATFAYPAGIAVDSSGNVYVCDYNASTIREISPSGTVSTIGGFPGAPGFLDGALLSTASQFAGPYALAIDTAGNLYITDQSSLSVIRKITSPTHSSPTVSSLAGQIGIASRWDGTGASANFNNAHGLAIDTSGNLYVADTVNNTIRKGVYASSLISAPSITTQPTSQTVTIGGSATLSVLASGSSLSYQWYLNGLAISGATSSTLTLNSITASNAGNYTCAISNSAGSAISTAAVISTTVAAPSIITQPTSQTVTIGGSATLSVLASGSSLSYQWYLNGVAITGATSPTYSVSTASAQSAGAYTVSVTNTTGVVTSNAVQMSVVIPGYLTDISVLSLDGPGSQLLSIGFTNGGAGTIGAENLLIRGAGPALAAFGISNYIPDPVITLFQGSNQIATNDNWGSTASNITAVSNAEAATGAFAYSPATGLDAALVQSLPSVANGYTVQISGKGNTTGQTIAEVYDYTPNHGLTSPRLTNLSTLLFIPSNSIATAGFVIGGTTPLQVLIRASGPTLAAAPFNLTSMLTDPMFKVFSGNTQIATNAGWAGTTAITAANSRAGAFQFMSATSKDSAVVLTLNPGSYSVQASSASGAAGTTLIELYEVP